MTENTQTKKCPFCGEDILAVATKCKHCGSDLSQVIAANEADALRTELKNVLSSVTAQHRPAKTKTLFFAPDIPADKIENAKQKYASKLTGDQEIFVLGEGKAMGFLMCGFVLTETAFYYFGVNDYSNRMAGSRKGVVLLHQVKSMEFKQGSFLGGSDHFVLNGMSPTDSDLIPKYFAIGEAERAFMNELFSALQSTLSVLSEQVQKAPPAPLTQQALPQQVRQTRTKVDNPVEAAAVEKPKPGCLKKGCGGTVAVIGLIIAAILFLLALWLAYSGMTHN